MEERGRREEVYGCEGVGVREGGGKKGGGGWMDGGRGGGRMKGGALGKPANVYEPSCRVERRKVT